MEIMGAAETAVAEQDTKRIDAELTEAELRAIGVILVLEGESSAFPLKLESLEEFSRHARKRPKWLLLSVSPATTDSPERATVWVSDEYRSNFLKRFEEYLQGKTKKGHPKHRELVANIARIRAATLDDLWKSQTAPLKTGKTWWELWLFPSTETLEHLERYIEARHLLKAERVLQLTDRIIVWVESTWLDLQALPFSRVQITEVRRPEFVDTIEDLDQTDQEELLHDFASRIIPADREGSPVICHLDTGVRNSHALLKSSLSDNDIHSIVDDHGSDRQNHGTLMAGLSLFGNLDHGLLGTDTVHLTHRLESVKILPDGGTPRDPLAYGTATALAVATPESTVVRPRVFSMPITSDPEGSPGEPSLWSASVDALAAGLGVSRSETGIGILGPPDPAAARLFLVSAGNVRRLNAPVDYLDECDTSVVEDPAQAWNALTVGAHTDLTQTPTDPSFEGWSALAEAGGLSPHSRTSLLFPQRVWPIKPEICMEGGNFLTNGEGDFHEAHPLVSVRSTGSRSDDALDSANATSAATAQASRLAALAMDRYPKYWPETIRGLLVHSAEWTPKMASDFDGCENKSQRLRLMRRYGWGVPNEQRVLDSTAQAVTSVVQDDFLPFDRKHRSRRFRLHELPWPKKTLEDLGAADVTLRVTLSYFIEPAASRRGWRRRYSYASHALRFELKLSTETQEQFVSRVNRQAEYEEDGTKIPQPTGNERWTVGPNQRNFGSLHQDIWDGSAADLASAGSLAVFPVGGWWKNNKRKDRVRTPLRYALIVSLKTSEVDVDLYTPIAAQVGVPTEIEINSA